MPIDKDKVIIMRFVIATILLFVLASTGSMAEQPNGNHYGNDKNGISGGKGKNKINKSVSAPGTLGIMGTGDDPFTSFSIW